jgi:hypothetical protein
MKRFIVSALKEGDVLAGRNLVSVEGEGIRIILGSTTNHNALIIRHNTRGWGVGDMFPPCGVFMPLSHYEDLVESGDYEIFVFRIKDATASEREAMSRWWQREIDGQPYSKFSMYRLWVKFFKKNLPWTIKGTWCTRSVGIVCAKVFSQARNPFRKKYVKGMPLKKNETPRTIENRVIQGMLKDVTDQVFHD